MQREWGIGLASALPVIYGFNIDKKRDVQVDFDFAELEGFEIIFESEFFFVCGDGDK